jgi:hypothetical protein
MTARRMIRSYARRGIRIKPSSAPDKVTVAPAEKLKPGDIEQIKAAKPKLLRHFEAQRMDWCDIEERACLLCVDELDGVTLMAAAYQMLVGDFDAIRDRWEALIDAMQPTTQLAEKLQSKSREMLSVDWLPRAVVAGWSERDLFGIHPTAPKVRVDAEGLVTSIILASWPLRLLDLNGEAARLVPPSGKPLIHPRRLNCSYTVPFWELQDISISAGTRGAQ